MYAKTGEQQFLERAVWVGEWLLGTAASSERGSCWRTSADATAIGYAHGSSGVALFLLYLSLSTNDERFLRLGEDALKHDMSYGRADRTGLGLSFPQYADESVQFPYWYVGSSGVGTVVLRYAVATGQEEFVSALDRIVPDACRKYTLFPGLFNGLAGLGNFLLDAHHFLGQDELLTKAHDVARGILLYRVDRPGGVAFPGDGLLRISTDY
jgi:hypothetical protein